MKMRRSLFIRIQVTSDDGNTENDSKPAISRGACFTRRDDSDSVEQLLPAKRTCSCEFHLNSCDVTGHFHTNQENCIFGEDQTHRVSGDVNLSSIPEDLIDFLVKKLDIKEEDWIKLGLKMGFPKLDVEYFKVQYKSESGSPTRSLLQYGGARGKTLNNLIAALCSQDVRRCDIGSCIQRYWIIY